jgi:CRP-like cAMP-binding protein
MNIPELFRNWKHTEEYPAETVIFSKGDSADVLYVVLSGEVRLTLNGSFLSVENGGAVIGETAMLQSATRNCTATAVGPVTLARLDRSELRELSGSNSEFSLHVMGVLADRLRAVDNYISEKIDPD